MALKQRERTAAIRRQTVASPMRFDFGVEQCLAEKFYELPTRYVFVVTGRAAELGLGSEHESTVLEACTW